jgi:hypothetical protein
MYKKLFLLCHYGVLCVDGWMYNKNVIHLRTRL